MKKQKLFLSLLMLMCFSVGNVWAEDYELYSGSITEGDYVIVYDGNAMNTTVTSNRLQFSAVTVANDKISNPTAAIIWHIAASGDYWTIYNAGENKYAAGTGTKNQAGLNASGTDDKSLWTVSGTSTYEFVNKKHTASKINANLRKNGTYGFACYATSTGGALSLYKKKSGSPEPTLSSISVSTAPTKTTYTEGEYFDPTGLVITRNYSNSTSNTYTYAGHTTDFSFTPSTSTALATSNTSVTINYGGKSITQAITVNAASSGGQGGGSGEDAGDGLINFGSAQGSTNVNAASVTGDDSRGKTWTVTTAGTTSFTPSSGYAQIGSGNKPASSITFTTTLDEAMTITAFSAQFGGFNGTAGTVTLKVGDTSVGTGSLNGTTDVTVNASNTTTSGTVLTVTVTGISKGVKAYYISYTVAATGGSGGGEATNPTISSHPASASYAVDATPTALSVSATASENGGTLHYQWKSNTTNSTEGATNVGTDAATYTPSTASAGTTYYFCVVSDDNGSTNSNIATIDVVAPLTTMQAIFSAATSTATDQIITFSNTWVVTGISTNGKNAYLTDGEKGLILFNNSASDQSPVAGLAAGNTLSGTVTRSLVLYSGAAELKDFTAEGLTKGTADLPAVQELDAEGIAALTGANTGSLIKINGKGVVDGTKYYIKYGSGDNDKVQVYNTLYAFDALTANANYECTGVYVQYNNTKEIAPRSAADLVKEVEKSQPNTYWDGAASGNMTVRANESIENLWTTASTGTKHFSTSDNTIATIANDGAITLVGGLGEVVLTFATDANEAYYAGEATLTLNVKAALPAGASEFKWVAADMGLDNGSAVGVATGNEDPISIVFAQGDGSNAPKYYTSGYAVRSYVQNTITISSAVEGKLIYGVEIVFANSTNNKLNGDDLSVDGTSGTWSGLAQEVVFNIPNVSGNQAHLVSINVIYANGTVTELEIANVAMKTTDDPHTIVPSCNVTPTPAISYEIATADQAYATIENGVITPKAVGGPINVTARIAQGSNYTAAVAYFTITVSEKQVPALSFQPASYDANLGSTFTAPTLTNPEHVTVAYSSSEEGVATVNASTGAVELVGEGTTTITAAFPGNGDFAANSASYTLNVADPYKDVLTATGLELAGYMDFSDKTFASGVKYAGNAMKSTTAGHVGAIQMRVQNPSGIVTTEKVGYLKSISATTTTANSEGRSLQIYAKATAYESGADLYDNAKQGTLIGTISKNGGEMEFAEGKAYSDNYKYIGIKANGGAVYYDEIVIKWEPAEFSTYSVTYKAGDDATGDDVVISNIDEGTTVQLAAKPDGFSYDQNHVFAGWKLDGEGDMLQAGADYEVNGNVTFVAQWSAAYTITYKAGEGSGSNVVVNNVPAGAYELAECTFTAPEGKIFAGWKLNGEGEILAAGASYDVAGSVEFVAQWTTATVVTFVAGTDKTDESILVKNGITIAASKFNGDSYYQRYSKAAMTISSEVGDIIKIELTCTGSDNSDYGPGKFSHEGYTYSGYVGTWAGTPTNEVTFGSSDGQVRMTQIAVTYVPNGNVPKTEAGLAYAVNEFTITVGDEFETPTLTNPYNVSVTYAGNNDQLATVNATTGALTLVEGAAGQITVTATFDGNNLYYAGNASYTLVVNEQADNVSGSWRRTADVEDGMRIIIAQYLDEPSLDAMGKDNTNNRAAVSSSVSSEILTPGFGTNVFTLVALGDNKYAIRASNGNYLCAASSSSNYLKEQHDLSDNGKWSISIGSDKKATIKAQGNYTHNIIRYNSSNKLFSCYASGQQDIAIYSKNAKLKADADASTLENYADVTVGEDKKLTVTTAKELGEIHLEEGAIIDTDDENASLTVENFYFKTKNGKSNQFTDPTKFHVTGDFFYDVKLFNGDVIDADYWYSIAVPFDVDINDGIYSADGTKLTNGTDYEVWGYDTEKRAQTMSNGWKRISGKMQAGHAYLIGFNPGMSNTVRLKAANTWKTNLFTASAMSMTEASNAADDLGRHSNWNGVANPTLHYIGINQDVQIFDNDNHTFSSFASATYNFVVGTAFFVQGTADIAIEDASHSEFRAPARMSENYAYSVRITRGEKAKFDNQIVIRASEDATDTYEQGHDMMTMNNATAPNALLWTENYGGTRLAIEEAPLYGNAASYELGVFAPAAGEYVLSVAEQKDNASLYLTYNGSIMWDLSSSPITLSLEKGVNYGYGLLMQVNAPHVATGVDNAEDADNAHANVQKIILNEHVYILRDGQLYDVTGKIAK